MPEGIALNIHNDFSGILAKRTLICPCCTKTKRVAKVLREFNKCACGNLMLILPDNWMVSKGKKRIKDIEVARAETDRIKKFL